MGVGYGTFGTFMVGYVPNQKRALEDQKRALSNTLNLMRHPKWVDSEDRDHAEEIRCQDLTGKLGALLHSRQ